VTRALQLGSEGHAQPSLTQTAKEKLNLLTEHEHQVMGHLISGQSNKVIACQLAISPRTVEVHRARLMDKLQACSFADVVRLAIAAGLNPDT
jgi:two-component system response regulator FixJ